MMILNECYQIKTCVFNSNYKKLNYVKIIVVIEKVKIVNARPNKKYYFQMFFKIFLYIFLSSSADHSKYRTCGESKFCSRDRFVSQQDWKLDKSTIKVKKNNFEAQIKDQLYNANLKLNIHFLTCGAARIRIEPSSKESFPRFDASEEPAIVSPTERASIIDMEHTKADGKSVIKATSNQNQILEDWKE